MNKRISLTALATLLSAAALVACDQASRMGASADNPFAGLDSAPAVDPAIPRAYVRYVPDRVDDVAWENDRVAFRIYGPELETAAPPLSSGIDAWAKKVRTPIINKWYTAGEHSYHIDTGEGGDVYKTGPSRGCGGIAIWNDAEKKLFTSKDWSTVKILSRGPQAAVFQVTYAPWRIATPPKAPDSSGGTGRKVWQVTTITLPMGSNLNRIETTLYSNEPGDITVGVGLATHGAADGLLWQDPKTGRFTWWDKADKVPDDKNDNGYMGAGAIVNPAQFVGFSKTDIDNFALIKVTPGRPFVYYAGSAWSKGLDLHTSDEWNHYIQNFPAKF